MENETQRIEAFSDGVFAIAITLLILEIKAPHLPPAAGGADMLRAIVGLWPSYFAYVFSFLTIGIYWANHHYIFKLYKRTDHMFNMLNIFFLMCISFLPFPTDVLGENVTNPHTCQSAIVFYNFGLLLPALGWAIVWLYASSGYRLIDKKLAPGFVKVLTEQYLLSILLYAISILLALWNGWVGLCVSLGLTFFCT